MWTAQDVIDVGLGAWCAVIGGRVMVTADKARLRDEAELAVMAWTGQGRAVTVLPKSLAPVCVAGGRVARWDGRRLKWSDSEANPSQPLNALFRP